MTRQPWTSESIGGLVPASATSAQVSLFGTPLSGGPDGYIDNVDVRVIDAADVLLFLEVNTSTGETSIKNLTGGAVNIDYYEVLSDEGAGASLLPSDGSWASLQDQDLAGFPSGTGVGDGWEEAGGSDAGVISESYLAGNSAINDGVTVSLGSAFDTSAAQDLVFRYGVVTGDAAPVGDYNGDGVVDGSDYAVWRETLGDSVAAGTGADGDGDGVIAEGDLVVWRGDYGASGGPSGTSTLVTGFVRYVTAPVTPTPEPFSVAVAAAGMTCLAACLRTRR